MTATEGRIPTAADVAHLKAGDEVDANSPLPQPPPARPDGWYVLTNPTDGEVFTLRSEAGEWVDGYGQLERFVAGCIVGPRLVELGPDDLVVNVPEDVRDDLVHFLQWYNSPAHQRGPLWVGSSMGEVTLAVARAVAEASSIPHTGQETSS